MADSWKAMDLNKFVVKDDMIDYVLHMYGSNWQVHDAIADDILDDLLKREWEKQKRVKYDKRKVTQMKIQDLLEKRIEKAGQHLNKEKQIMHINKGKEKMVMERDFIIIESDTSYDYFPRQTTSDESSNHNPFQATFDESYDHNPFQVTSDESSDDILLMIITIQIPHILHLEGKLFDSRGCLLLVRRDDFGSREFTIYEMMKGSSV
ncbi:hypothetical protein Tco_0008250 [Tanacetum coccineum]